MPKDRRDNSKTHDRHRTSPYTCSSRWSRQSSSTVSSESEENLKEWEEARCPVCMEHPHNAILLICTSHEKGCRPYMCDTSYRHSNCFDQFRKSFQETSSMTFQQEQGSLPDENLSSVVSSEEPTVNELSQQAREGTLSNTSISCENKIQHKLVCPLCRGRIKDWTVKESARQFMNAKLRSCACEACDFSGTYVDLRKHARREHPTIRPSEADPERERNWRRLERQRDLGDLLSTLQSSIGEERGDELSTLQSSIGEERGDDGILPIDDGGWLTVFFLIRVFRPGSRPRSGRWSSISRAGAQLSFRRRSTRLWGDSLDGEAGSSSRDEDNDSSDGGSVSLRHSERLQRQPTPDV